MKGRIVVVEAETDVVLAAALRGEDLEVARAGSGRAALQALEAGTPDVMLVDLRLPDMDGLELLDLIKQARPELPVIVMGAHASARAAVHAMRRGAEDFLVKPYETSELQSALTRSFTRKATVHRFESPANAPRTRIPGSTLYDLEREAILRTLEAVSGSTSKAAAMLGISARKIQYKVKEYREEQQTAAASPLARAR